MLIASGSVQHLQVPIDHPVKTAFGTMRERHALFLLLHDEDGRQGIGESWVNFPSWAPWERAAAYERAIIPWLTGREIDDVPRAIGELYGALRGPAEQSGTVGALLPALCGVELALWDLAAQRENLSLSRLLFDRPKSQVRVYASGINSPLPWNLIDAHLECGVTLFKLKMGFGIEEDRANLSALRRHLGDAVDIAVDVNRGWTLAHAQAMLPELADMGVAWLEEPVRLEDEAAGLPALRERRLVPIAAAENTMMPPGCDIQAIAASPADILQPDLTKYAPLHVVRDLIDVATTGRARLVPHFLGSGPGQAATLHFAAGCPEGLVEMDINCNPLRTDYYQEPFHIEDGSIRLPDAAGLGWTPRA